MAAATEVGNKKALFSLIVEDGRFSSVVPPAPGL
jgi:hypothetical protein